MASRRLEDCDPALQPIATEFFRQLNASVAFESAHAWAFPTCTFRSNAEQDADYASGRTLPGPVKTNAKAGQSPHNCVANGGKPASRAFDFAIKAADGSLDWNAGDALWQTAIMIGTSLGLISGAHWHSLRDNPHFEMPNWRSALPTS